jgi:hypothetical protein
MDVQVRNVRAQLAVPAKKSLALARTMESARILLECSREGVLSAPA